MVIHESERRVSPRRQSRGTFQITSLSGETDRWVNRVKNETKLPKKLHLYVIVKESLLQEGHLHHHSDRLLFQCKHQSSDPYEYLYVH